jgi:alkylation response protein AidB-like acyl-CoA dehydrogenase
VDVDQHSEGAPETVMVYFPREQCEIIDTWDVMGMRGTGSNDISVTDVFVPKSRTFRMVPEFEPGSHYQGPLYRLPLVGAPATGIPTPMLGVARRALDEVTELALTKNPVASSGLLRERPSAQVQLGKAEAVLRSGRLLLLDTVREAWQRCVDGRPHSLKQKADLLLASTHAMSSAVQAVELASPPRRDMEPSGKCVLECHRTFPWWPSNRLGRSGMGRRRSRHGWHTARRIDHDWAGGRRRAPVRDKGVAIP